MIVYSSWPSTTVCIFCVRFYWARWTTITITPNRFWRSATHWILAWHLWQSDMFSQQLAIKNKKNKIRYRKKWLEILFSLLNLGVKVVCVWEERHRGTLSEKHVNDDLLQAGVEAAARAQALQSSGKISNLHISEPVKLIFSQSIICSRYYQYRYPCVRVR